VTSAEAPDPVEFAARALRHRDRSSRDVDELLARAGVDETGRAEALDTLRRLGYVDDARFAAARAEALAGRGYGDAAIEFDLGRQGVGDDVARDAVAALTPERERAARVVARDGATARIARRLVAKGFAQATVEHALRADVADGDAEPV